MFGRHRVPGSLPLLSAGRHRRPRSGACVMEYVSVLAGERWSDRPRSVCPTLAAMARAVNDRVSDGARQRLAPFAPDFIGTAGADAGTQAAAARRVLTTALDHAHDEPSRARVLVALLALHRAGPGCEAEVRRARERHPAAVDSAEAFVDTYAVAPDDYLRRGLPASVATGVDVIARGAGDAADGLLLGLLADTVDGYRRALAATAPRRPSGSVQG